MAMIHNGAARDHHRRTDCNERSSDRQGLRDLYGTCQTIKHISYLMEAKTANTSTAVTVSDRSGLLPSGVRADSRTVKVERFCSYDENWLFFC